MRKFLNLLSRQDDDASDSDERRQHNRRPIDAAVVVEVDTRRHDCRLSNIGPGGGFLTPSFDVEVGQQVTVSIPNSPIRASVGVRRVELAGVGVKFDDDTLGAIVAGWSRGLFD